MTNSIKVWRYIMKVMVEVYFIFANPILDGYQSANTFYRKSKTSITT